MTSTVVDSIAVEAALASECQARVCDESLALATTDKRMKTCTALLLHELQFIPSPHAHPATFARPVEAAPSPAQRGIVQHASLLNTRGKSVYGAIRCDIRFKKRAHGALR